jgi:uncharacterized protein (TIGR03790 family)
MTLRTWFMIGMSLLTGALPAQALTPDQVFILVNQNVPASREIAEYYCARRGVPKAHIIALDLPTGEDITREDYNKRLLAPLRQALKNQREQAKVLLSIYGVPLRVGPQRPTAEEQAQLVQVKAEIEKLQKDIRTQQDQQAALPQLRTLLAREQKLSFAQSQAAVDSELSLLWWEHYDLSRWQLNRLYFQVPESVRTPQTPVVMVSRLDGPSVALVKELVDQALSVEKHGLAGKVYVDARGIRFDSARHQASGYEGYDESLREMARLLEHEAKLPVVLDDKPGLFASGSCRDCALYCGWYSLAKYVDCCRFVPGAVAYHIASSEAVSLRDPRSTQWCKCLLEHGVAATLGPVAEPYLMAFPKPAEFFGFLVTGQDTLVECYYKTTLLTSWMMVLVGDPLYNPYGAAPKLKGEQIKPSPLGTRLVIGK